MTLATLRVLRRAVSLMASTGFFLACALGALYLTSGIAHATNYIYTGLAATCPFPAEQCNEFVPGNPAAWGDHRNWSPQGVPGAGDTAIINGNSSVNLGGTRTVLRLTLNNGSQFGTGLEGGTVNITGTAPTFISSWTTGNFACNVNIAAGAQLNIAGNNAPGRAIVGGTVNNSGTVNWSGNGGISCVSSPTFNNLSGGVFNASSNAQWAPNVGTTAFNNQAGATFNKIGAGTSTDFSFVNFNNAGTVNAVAGLLRIDYSNGTNPGTFTTASGARVNVSGIISGTLNAAGGGIIGLHDATLNTGTQCIGAGKSQVFDGTVIVNGSVTAGETGGPGTLEIAPDGFNGINFTGTPGGSLACAGSGIVEWKSGNIGDGSGGVVNLASSCRFNISGDVTKNLFGDTINNSGLVTWTGEGGVNCLSSPIFNNLSGGIFNAQSDAQWAPNAGVTTFNNQAGGVFNRSGGGTTTIFSFVNFNNAGTVNAQSGLLRIDYSNGTSAGTFTAANGARVNVSGGISGTLNAATGGIIGLQDATLNSGARCIGAGKSQVFEGTVSVNGTVTVGQPGGPGRLELAPDGFSTFIFTGTPAGSLTCDGTGFIDWQAGTVGTGAGGVINIASDGIFKISSPSSKILLGATINNAGVMTWSDGTIQMHNDAVINNLNGGVFNTPAAGNLSRFSGTTPAFNNAGALNIGGVNSSGKLDMVGVTFSNSGTVNLEIGGATPGTQYDQINSDTNVTLAGTLNISFINGFHPNGGTFSVMTYPSHLGDFSTVNGLNVGGGRILTASANPTDYVIADLNQVVTTRTVSGRVTNSSGVGVANITIKRTGSTSVATTDGLGNYSFTNVAPGTVTITPNKVGYTFSPTSRTFNVAGTDVTGVNFTATVATFTITGRVTNHSGAGIPNVLVARNGTSSVATDANGNFAMTGVTIGEYVIAPVLTPTLNGVTFNPPSYLVNVTTSNLSNINFTASFTVTGRVSNHSGAGISNVQIQRVAGSSTVSTFTDSNGNYRFTGVRSGSYIFAPVLTPAMAGTSFTPTSRNVTVDRSNITNQNFIGMFSVSGRVATSGGAGMPNVLMRLSTGATSTTTLTDSNGNYQFNNVRSGDYTITATQSGKTFSPASRSITVGTISILNQTFTGFG